MKTIDVTGLPGSGKSTMISVIKKVFYRNNLIVVDEKDLINRFFQKKYWFLVFLISYLSSSFREKVINKLYKLNLKNIELNSNDKIALEKILKINNKRNIPDLDKIKINYWLKTLMIKKEFSKKYVREDEFLLIDEFFVHRSLSLFTSKEEEFSIQKLTKYLKIIEPPNYLIVIRTSIDICMLRMKKRGFPQRYSSYTFQEISETLEKSKKIIEHLESYYSRLDCKVILLDNENEIMYDFEIPAI